MHFLRVRKFKYISSTLCTAHLDAKKASAWQQNPTNAWKFIAQVANWHARKMEFPTCCTATHGWVIRYSRTPSSAFWNTALSEIANNVSITNLLTGVGRAQNEIQYISPGAISQLNPTDVDLMWLLIGALSQTQIWETTVQHLNRAPRAQRNSICQPQLPPPYAACALKAR